MHTQLVLVDEANRSLLLCLSRLFSTFVIIKQADIDFAKIEGKNLAISVVDSQRYSNVSGSGSASYSEFFESSQKTCRVQLSYINILFSRRLVVTNDNLRGLVNFQIQFRKQMIGA
ncbi:hypothetical protein HanRHA438_Chr04g0191211 [Helianthus annuus]|nr:hypothetical protein HanRHA438_Chr04g0191211 [Helianthus annuus]